MSTPLLATKLFIPKHKPGTIARQALLDMLDLGLVRRLTLISAPAGFGKTTLVAAWCEQCKIPTCWVSLDESDNDMKRFLAYFIAALATASIEVDDQLPSLIQTPGSSLTDVVLIPILNQISEAGVDFVLVLDDYHLIQNQEIHAAIAFLLDHASPSMHLVMVTRADPPLPLARLRARGQMTEIRAAHLRFSTEEGDAFLNQVQGLDLAPEAVETLVRRVDGWAAALQMVSLALQGHPDPGGYIHDLSGSQAYIADYLTEEVLQGQTEQVQDFLLKTSILDQLSGSLCDAVTGGEDSQELLKRLVEANLFITPLDDTKQWFSYHQLFASLLQGRLSERYADVTPGLYLNASHWYDNYGYKTEAIEYALRGNHFERAATLIEQGAIDTLTRGEVNTCLRWMEKLPVECIRRNPTLGILYAWTVLVCRGDKVTARSFLERIDPETNQIESRLDTVRAILSVFEGHINEGIELARGALAQLPSEDHFFRNMAAWNLSGSLAVSGDIQGSLELLREVVDTSLASQNYLIAVIALCRLGAAWVQYGDLYQAKEILDRAVSHASIGRKSPLPAASEAFMWLGRIFWEWDQLQTAIEYLQDSISLSKRWRDYTVIDSYVVSAHILQSFGDVEGASHRMVEALWIAVENQATENDDRYVACQQAYLWIRQGNLQDAHRWATGRDLGKPLSTGSLDLSGKVGADLIMHYELIVFARLLLAGEDFESALSLLELLFPYLEKTGDTRRVIEIHILKAIAFYFLKDLNSATASLETAVDLAIAGEYTRVFVEEGEVMRTLLQGIKARGDKSIFVTRLLEKLIPPGKPKAHIDLIEPLSERELEILKMLKTELTAPEIAEHLHIAVSTMRTHTKNIYNKLGVHSRFEAITKAEEFGL